MVGDDSAVLSICSGGFLLDAEFSPPRLHELAKMDGAIILASDASRIARANVHLVPSPELPTSETGTRHRTAERVARYIDVPVIAVSEAMSIVSVYRNDLKHPLQPLPLLVNRANQALQTLERYKNRLDAVTASLSAREIEDQVTLRDVVTVLQRAEMVRRIAEEVDGYLVELGDDGRLLMLQLDELMGGVNDDRRLVVRDYLQEQRSWHLDQAMAQLRTMSMGDLLDLNMIARALRLGQLADGLDAGLTPRGYRLLSLIPKLPASLVDPIVDRFGGLPEVMGASVGDLEKVGGVGVARARLVKKGLGRLVETSAFDR